jgi:tetratricopeptide (TPR) repeat protein
MNFDALFSNAVKALETQNYVEAVTAGTVAYESVGRRDLKKALPCCVLLSKAYIHSDDRLRGSLYLSEAVSIVRRGNVYESREANAAMFGVLGEIFELLSDREGEEQMYKEYLAQMQEIVGDDHVATSDCYHLLTGFYMRNADIASATECCEKACTIRCMKGIRNELAGQSLFSLGLIYKLGGELQRALDTFQDAVEAKTSVYGPKSLDVAEAQLSAGFCAQQLENLDVAFDLYQKSFQTRNFLLGAEHRLTKEAFTLVDFVRKQRKPQGMIDAGGQ